MRLLSCLAALCLATACARIRPASEPDALRVLVYNTHAGKDASGTGNLERLAALVRETRADLVLLQEVDSATTRSGGVDQLSVVRSATQMHGAFGGTLVFQGGRYGLAVLSRFPIRMQQIVMLSGDTEPATGRSREPRGALHVVVARPAGDLHVVNTHLDASADDTWRREEATRLVALADSLRAAGARVMIGGDLNAIPGSAVHSIFRNAELRDVWPECGKGPEATYPAHAPARRIDYLLLTAAMQCTGASVIATDASDHRPVLADVSVR
jgi:endonuclease/exonuclease/phosphatase family metal-dependent hydrolase